MAIARIPLALKLGYTLWAVVWFAVYYRLYGPGHFLWICDFANLVLCVALWLESPVLIASQAVGVLLIQLLWNLDVAVRLVAGFHPIGGTEYMFNAGTSLGLRSLSLFHTFVPLILLWAIWRLGYDRRGWKLQTLIVWFLIPASYLWTAPEANINWLVRPFGVPQTLMPPPLFVLVVMLAVPIIGHLPTHWVLLRAARRWGRGVLN